MEIPLQIATAVLVLNFLTYKLFTTKRFNCNSNFVAFGEAVSLTHKNTSNTATE